MLLLGKALMIFFFTFIDKLRNLVSQSFILQVTNIGEGRMDGSDDSRGEGSCVCGWLRRSS